MKPERMPPIPREKMNEAQLKVAAEIAAGPRGEVRGPFNVLIRSPELCGPIQRVGEYLRFRAPLDRRLAEMATLMAARHWTQQYEWNSHYQHAMKAGLNPSIAQAIAEGRRPTGMGGDEEILYDMLLEGLNHKSVCDETYARALEKFGEQGIVELLTIAGYYGMLALLLNVARTKLPAGREPQLPVFPD